MGLHYVVLLHERLLRELPVHRKTARVPPLGAQRLDLPRVEDGGGRFDALPQRRGVVVEVDPRAPAPRLAAHGYEVDVARLQVVLGEHPLARDEGVLAVDAVAPSVERADESALARAPALDDPDARGGGTRSGTPALPCRRCAARSPTGRGTRTRRNRSAAGSPRAGTPSARPAATASRPPSGRSRRRSSAPCGPGPGPPPRTAPRVPTTSDPRSPRSSPFALSECAAGERYSNRPVGTTIRVSARAHGHLWRPNVSEATRRAGRRRRYHRYLPAVPRPRGRFLRHAARSR